MMHIALAAALGSILVAPFVGRWRANVWMQRQSANQASTASALRQNNVVEIA